MNYFAYLILIVFSVSCIELAIATEVEPTQSVTEVKVNAEKNKEKDTATKAETRQPKLAKNIVTIESKVTGSQEQPKVLYIMPWQGINNPITVKDKEMQLMLPKVQPIYPKIFKQQVRAFAAEQTQKSVQQTDSRKN